MAFKIAAIASVWSFLFANAEAGKNKELYDTIAGACTIIAAIAFTVGIIAF